MDIFREIGGVFQQVVSMSLTAGLVILAICAARLLLRQAPKKVLLLAVGRGGLPAGVPLLLPGGVQPAGPGPPLPRPWRRPGR